MSFFNCEAPHCGECAAGITITSRSRNLDGFNVRRVLPAPSQRMVGPFVFFDHMGPIDFAPGQGIEVRPHPHIGIATITYLFEGEILHRDSLGVVQPIQPGAVNLMTAGSGITHSERPGADHQQQSRLHGIQSWIALPRELQEMDPAFRHFPAATLPLIETNGMQLRLIMGELLGEVSPVTTYSPTLYAECLLEAGAQLELPFTAAQLAIYVAEGTAEVCGKMLTAGEMLVLNPREQLSLRGQDSARLMLVGGEPLGHRHMFWNFVSDDPARIEQAKNKWREGQFPRVPGDSEYAPLPE